MTELQKRLDRLTTALEQCTAVMERLAAGLGAASGVFHQGCYGHWPGYDHNHAQCSIEQDIQVARQMAAQFTKGQEGKP